VQTRIQKANSAFIQFIKYRNLEKYLPQQNCEFKTNVKSVLLCGCETWKLTKKIFESLQTFINRWLSRIFNIFWPEASSNERILQMAREKPRIEQIKQRK
jgi:hypothetical protein